MDLGDEKFLFSGDTLFPGGPGKTIDSRNFSKIFESIKNKLYLLPKETIILPGHGESITIEDSINELIISNIKIIYLEIFLGKIRKEKTN